VNEGEDFSVLNSVKQCPVCGGRLEKEYFNAPKGVSWDTVKHKWSYVWGGFGMPTNIPALRCEKCKIAILDYAERTPKSSLKECVKCGKEIPIASEECQYCGAKQPQK
jgi:hypothetical protein